MKKTKQILFFATFNKGILTFILLFLFQVFIHASSGNSNVLDSLSSATITLSEKTSPTIYISPDALLYNADDMYIHNDYSDAKILKHSTNHKKKTLYVKKNVSQKVKLAKPMNLKKTFKELPNHKYFTISGSINSAIVNTFKYTLKQNEDIRVGLIHHFNHNYNLYSFKNIILFNKYKCFFIVRPPPETERLNLINNHTIENPNLFG